ncbi:tetratricopeptide repeat protein, partial [Corallococcus sp. 4LFB]|uniref:tetratricopeptide repeat protein n=1 Tax=Corallococcus sp. 4LFB TaxID=3383249 RepID=UPI0039750295
RAAPAPAPQAHKPGAALPPMPASLSTRAASVEAVEAQLRAAEQSLRFVETQFTERPEPSSTDSQLKRFSEGEVYSLLGDWAAASVLFYDLVSDPDFKANPRYPEAVFYLADALYQQKNDIGARVYLRDVLSLPLTPQRYKEAVSRYLAVAGRLQQFEGIDAYVDKARQLSGGVLAPDIAYVHARGTFKRLDLSPEEHQQRSRALFAPLAQGPGAFRVQAVYHLGVLSVQGGDYPAAIAQFQRIVGSGPDAVVSTGLSEAEAQRFRELAYLSLGRLMYETGRYDEALDHYGQIPRESERFPESLLEVAWTYVRKQDFTQAKNATDILLLVAPDSQLAPEARILQGHLLQKLRQYDEALETYEGVVRMFMPARDKVDALLRVNHDPVAYFDNLLARNERSLDVSTLLPPLALKYASTQKEVADAVRMVGDLDSGRQGAGEAKAIAERILEALDARGLEAFPELQEGYVRAEAVDTALTAVEQSLVQAEAALVEEKLTPAEREKLLVAQAPARPSGCASRRCPPPTRSWRRAASACRRRWTRWTARPSAWATSCRACTPTPPPSASGWRTRATSGRRTPPRSASSWCSSRRRSPRCATCRRSWTTPAPGSRRSASPRTRRWTARPPSAPATPPRSSRSTAPARR